MSERCTAFPAGLWLIRSEVYAMADVIPFEDAERAAAREQARLARQLRQLAEQIEALLPWQCREALPVAAGGLEEIRMRLRPWLGERDKTS